MAANVVVIDDRMACGSMKEVYIAALYVISAAVSSTLNKLSVFRKGYMITAIKLAHDAIYDANMSWKARKVAIMAAMSYCGVGQEKGDEGMIDKLAFVISSRFGLNYNVVFYILAPHAMDMYMNRDSSINTKILAALIGNDNVVKVPFADRTVAIIEEGKRIYRQLKKEENIATSLSQLGLSPEEIELIYIHGVNIGYIIDSVETKRAIVELLNRAL